MKPAWLEIAEGYIGTKEIAGAGNSPVITKWLISLKAWWRDDLTPWCGVFCGECMRQAGVSYPKAYYRAGAWLDWGRTLDEPLLGCIAVKSRKGGNHVFLVAGISQDGNSVIGLGGNQHDSVSYAVFNYSEITGWRWPFGIPLGDPLPVVNTNVILARPEKLS